MKIGFLFAGQGAQKVGMGKDLYLHNQNSQDVYNQMTLDFPVKEICFEGPEELLNDTRYTQACILTTSLAIAKAVESLGIHPDYVAGLSLGEYSALCYAGVLDLQDAGNIVRKRGILMANALPKGTSGMVAVMQMDPNTIQTVLDDVDGIVEIANYNCPGQIVITGEKHALQKAMEKLKEQGCRRMIPLNVSGAFHSSLLEGASIELKKVLATYTFHQPKIPVVYNVSGKVETTHPLELLGEQIKSSVLFEQSVRYMMEQGVDTFIEIGPGKTLQGFVKKISKDVRIFSVNDTDSLQQLKEALDHE